MCNLLCKKSLSGPFVYINISFLVLGEVHVFIIVSGFFQKKAEQKISLVLISLKVKSLQNILQLPIFDKKGIVAIR